VTTGTISLEPSVLYTRYHKSLLL